MFNQGVAAFQDGDLERALDQFLSARWAGMDTGALHYNLGVVYYRLGRYEAAESEFRHLLDDPETAPVGHYNLGLIAQRQGRTDTASMHFRTALDTADGSGLQRLSRMALDELEPHAGPRRWRGLLSLAGGYDDNVTLAPQADLIGVTESDDVFLELLAAGRYQLAGAAADGWQLDTALYLREYYDVEDFNQAALRIGITRSRSLGRWQTSLGGQLDAIWLDRDHFSNIYTLSIQGVRRLGSDSQLRLRYRGSRFKADEAFDQLTGWRHRVRSEGRRHWDLGSLHLGHELEWNDRNDLRSDTQFFSLSPLRNTLYVDLVIPAGIRWEFTMRGQYRNSRYRDANVTAAGSEQRRDDRMEASVRVDHRLRSDIRLFGIYTHADNDSTIAAFDYVRNEFLAGVERVF